MKKTAILFSILMCAVLVPALTGCSHPAGPAAHTHTFGDWVESEDGASKTRTCTGCGYTMEYIRMSMQDFITELGSTVEHITAVPAETPGITWSSDHLTANVYRVSLTGASSPECHFSDSLVTADLKGLDTSEVTGMKSMFSGCDALESLDVSSFDTSHVTDMQNMFRDCEVLESLNVRSFNTSLVTDMYMMFSGCEALESLDLGGFDTSHVTNMGCMFDYCESLTSLNVRSFDTSHVGSMSRMFNECSALQTLDVSSFVVSGSTTCSSMFQKCTITVRYDPAKWTASTEASDYQVAGSVTFVSSH